MDILREIGHRITDGPTLGYAMLVLALILAPRIAEALRLPAMVGRGAGRLLFTASVASTMPGPFYATYAASKSFVLSFAGL